MIVHEFFVERGDGARRPHLAARRGMRAARCCSVRPLLSGRDYHALMRENAAFDFDGARRERGNVDVAAVCGPARDRRADRRRPMATSPTWYRNFLYARGGGARARLRRGPGVARRRSRSISRRGDAVVRAARRRRIDGDAAALGCSASARPEMRATQPLAPLDRAAESYIVRRGAGHTIIAGYPVVHRLGPRHVHRDARTVLARGRLDIAASILARTGPARCRKACCRTASPIDGEAPRIQLGRRIALVRDRRRTSSSLRSAVPQSAVRDAARRRGQRHPRRATRAARATASAWTATACSPAACRACSSPGWTRRSATTWSRRASASRWRCRRCGSTRCARRPGDRTAMRSRGASGVSRALLERAAALPVRRGRCRPRPGPRRCERAAEPDLRGRRPAVRARSTATWPRAVVATVERELVTPMGLRTLSPRRPRVSPAVRRRRRAARRRLSPGHGVALAHRARSSMRGCA